MRWSHGGSSWYKVRPGRSVVLLINHFRGYDHFRWARLHYYYKGQIGRKYFWFNREKTGGELL